MLTALQQTQVPRLLDGRSAPAYWGETIRATRGGHLPGAELVPANELRSGLKAGKRRLAANSPIIAYAHDPYSGLAYLTLLRAGLGLDARLYVNGWREWAGDGRLPAEATTYPQTTTNTPQSAAGRARWLQSLLIGAAVLVAALTGFMYGRRTT